jgi:alpha-L-rhamnosidase
MAKKLFSLLLLCCGSQVYSVSDKGKLNVARSAGRNAAKSEGLGVLQPRFSWKLVSEQQDLMQSAYQIDVAATEKT